MYAVIKTGGKQYRVQAGDLLVVDKLDGDAGAEVSFGEVLMMGDGSDFTIGAPAIDGASVTATLIETRKGEKIKVFKKIRRQGYRRTQGHRQHETVLRVTAVAGGGKEAKWDGKVDLTPKSVLDARARNLAPREAQVEKPAKAAAAEPEATTVEPAAKKPAARKTATAKTAASKTAAPKAAAKKPAAKKPAAKPASDAQD